MGNSNLHIGKQYKHKETKESYYVTGFSRIFGLNQIILINENSESNKSKTLTEEQVNENFNEVE